MTFETFYITKRAIEEATVEIVAKRKVAYFRIGGVLVFGLTLEELGNTIQELQNTTKINLQAAEKLKKAMANLEQASDQIQ